MDKHTRRLWRSARTVDDLARLMAGWLDGDLPYSPNYEEDGEYDPETAPLAPHLAAYNRGGFLTTDSQPACEEPGFDHLIWRQRAAVSGFIADVDLVKRVTTTARRAGLLVIAHGPRGALDIAGEDGIYVTIRDVVPCTRFGEPINRSYLRRVFHGCHRDAIRAVHDAWQVTVIDPEWARKYLLWQTLDSALPALALAKETAR
ncbi:hypothetical protein ABZ752_22765 [Streptomyces roseifaciens]